MYVIVRYVILALLILTGLNALIAGLLFIIAPSGQLMGMDTAYLQHAPFATYLIPGLVLMLVNGMLNILAAYATIKKANYHGIWVLVQGILLGGWIMVQVFMVQDFNGLHATMLSIAAALTCGGWYLYAEGT